MELEKVTFLNGNNKKFDYYILERKEDAAEKELDTESLAYKIAGPGKFKVSKYGQLPFGNNDYLLEERTKETQDFHRLRFAQEDEVQF